MKKSKVDLRDLYEISRSKGAYEISQQQYKKLKKGYDFVNEIYSRWVNLLIKKRKIKSVRLLAKEICEII